MSFSANLHPMSLAPKDRPNLALDEEGGLDPILVETTGFCVCMIRLEYAWMEVP